MKRTILLVLTAILVYAGPSTAQDFYNGLPHTPINHARVASYQQQQRALHNQLVAYMVVLHNRQYEDNKFHLCRFRSTKEHTIYNDALAIQLQQQAITRNAHLLDQLELWLKYYDLNNE